MARFSLRRPSEIFRRHRSADSSTTASRTASSTATSTSHSPPPPLRRAKQQSPTAKRPATSSSLGRLREKFVAQQQQHQQGDGGIPSVPAPPSPAAASRLPPLQAGEVRQNSASAPHSTTPARLAIANRISTPVTEAPPPPASEAASTASRGTTPATRATPSPSPRRSGSETLASEGKSTADGSLKLDVLDCKWSSVDVEELRLSLDEHREPQEHEREPQAPTLIVEVPTPDVEETLRGDPQQLNNHYVAPATEEAIPHVSTAPIEVEYISSAYNEPLSTTVAPRYPPITRPQINIRKQSLVNSVNAQIVPTLLESPVRPHILSATSESVLSDSARVDYFSVGMMHRKIWVSRPGASATLVQIREDDLVDDVRDMILRKYANSLGKVFDSPDMTLRIAKRADHGGQRTERLLGPEEAMCRTIDAYYPGGQHVDEALIIDVPPKRTPRPSPRAFQQNYHAMDELRPAENGSDYFPPMPAMIQPTMPQTTQSHDSRGSHQTVIGHPEHIRAMSVLNTGQVPPLPSPGAGGRRPRPHERPKIQRQHTSSPTIVQHRDPQGGAAALHPMPNAVLGPHQNLVHRQGPRPRVESNASERPHLHVNGGMMGPNMAPPPPPLPSPPAPEAAPTNMNASSPPTPAGGPTARPARPRKHRKPTPDSKPSSRHRSSQRELNGGGLASSVLDGSVPPINVLIVEDNIINLRILEGLMKRLKVRWQTAMNGQIAVDKWKAGGFHLVLMDIQMPIMNGLQATKEIRRLERVNGIGVFSSSASPSPIDQKGQANGTLANGASNDCLQAEGKGPQNDKLDLSEGLFKSPIIIVALTASSLQSDRHEALAAGCNDFLTKPVNFVWLERKVKEWGCMQALIDFDGWRRWKDYASREEAGKSVEQKEKDRLGEEKQKKRMEKMAILQEKQRKRQEGETAKKEAERKRRESFEAHEAVAASSSNPAAGNGTKTDGQTSGNDG